jgi:diazepam-binding inhibitor (GABA receptor modulating acyl-CoA-binding protein)
MADTLAGSLQSSDRPVPWEPATRGVRPWAKASLGPQPSDADSLSVMAGTEFEQAVKAVGELANDPGNDTKLRLYALYKQATVGDVTGKRPGFLDMVGRAKYDAWAGLAGTSSAQAEADYVAEVGKLS